jgi:hypothetical protein
MSQSPEFEDRTLKVNDAKPRLTRWLQRVEHYEPALNRQTEPASTIAGHQTKLKSRRVATKERQIKMNYLSEN